MTTDMAGASGPCNAMSVDVEDYFQVSAFERHISRDAWEQLPCRVEANTRRVLALFAEHDVRATFFVLGWVAERYPGLLREIADAGHEVASHGYGHVRITEQTPEQFRQEAMRTKALLEDVSGQAVNGFRAASFSIGESNLWALDVLEESGHRYSSSIYPVNHDLYGMPDAPRFAFRRSQGGMLEIPITTVPMLGRNIPCGGGGYFRLYPYAFSRWAIRQVNERDGQSAVFYFHPWEVDPDQPRPHGLPLKTRFRHYLNLKHMSDRLGALLRDFRWGRVDDVFLPAKESTHELDLGESVA